MTYAQWLDLVKQAGADIRVADPNWLQHQFNNQVSPGQVAHAIKTTRQAPPVSIPPVQARLNPQSSAPGKNLSSPYILPTVIGSVLLVLIIAINLSLGRREDSSKADIPSTNVATNITVEPSNQVDNTPNAQTEPNRQSSQADEEFARRWSAVQRIFTDQGVSVEPWDRSAPWTMRAYIPSRIAMDVTQTQARELAGMARSRLGENAIVYIKSEGGKHLQKLLLGILSKECKEFHSTAYALSWLFAKIMGINMRFCDTAGVG